MRVIARIWLSALILLIPSLSAQGNTKDKPLAISQFEETELRELHKNSTFQELYDEARKSFSTRTEYYRLLIDIMNSKRNGFTTEQRQRLEYLQSYRLLVDGHYDKAAAKAIKTYDELVSDTLKINAAVLIINASVYAHDFNTALYYLDLGQELIPNIDAPSKTVNFYYNISYLYFVLKKYDLALNAVNKALSVKNISDFRRCESLSHRIDVLFEMKKLESNSPSIDEALHSCVATKKMIFINIIKRIRISLLLEENQIEPALAALDATMPDVLANNIHSNVEAFNFLYARTFFALEKLDLAKEYAEQIIAQSKISTTLPHLIGAHKVLYDIAVKNNDLQGALAHYKDYEEARRANLSEDAKKLLAIELARFQVTEKNNQIRNLNSKNKVLLLEQQLTMENQQNNQLIITLLSVILLFLGLWMYRSNQVQRQLREIAQVDYLTRIANRRYFSEQAEKQLLQAKANGQTLSMLLFDLDKFKSINDTYGHAIGDWVLEKTAEVCKDTIRDVDVIGRLGGEEFGIMLPNCNRHRALNIANDCRKALLNIDTSETGFTFTVSGSFGLSDVEASSFELKDLLHNCDEALYEGKRRGRNCVVGYPFETSTSEKAVDTVH